MLRNQENLPPDLKDSRVKPKAKIVEKPVENVEKPGEDIEEKE